MEIYDRGIFKTSISNKCAPFMYHTIYLNVCYQYKVAQSQYHRSPSGAERSYGIHQGDFKEGNLS